MDIAVWEVVRLGKQNLAMQFGQAQVQCGQYDLGSTRKQCSWAGSSTMRGIKYGSKTGQCNLGRQEYNVASTILEVHIGNVVGRAAVQGGQYNLEAKLGNAVWAGSTTMWAL